MKKVAGIFQILLAFICFSYALMHGLGQMMSFSSSFGDPEYSRVVLFGKFLIPVLFILLGYRSGKAGIGKLKTESQN